MEAEVQRIIEELFIETPRESTRAIWDDTVVSHFSNLSYADLYDYQVGAGHDTYVIYGSTQWPRYIMCNMPVLQRIISGSGGGDDSTTGSCTTSCVYTRPDCCDEDDTECINYGEDGAEGSLEERAQGDPYDWNPLNHATGTTQDLTWPKVAVSYG